MKDSIFSDKFFRVAFAASLISHTFLFMKGPSLSFFQNDKPMEITYIEPERSVKDIIEEKAAVLDKSRLVEKTKDVQIVKGFSDEEKIFDKNPKRERKEEKIFIKEIKKEVPFDEKAVYEMPAFCDYYKYLRNQIRQTIFRPRPFKPGEVVIRFTLLRDGTLKEVGIIDKLSAKNAYLRYAAVKAVKDAAPFKSFPEDLAGIKEMPFQVPISFELAN